MYMMPPKYAAQIAMMRHRREISKETSAKLIDYFEAKFSCRYLLRLSPFDGVPAEPLDENRLTYWAAKAQQAGEALA